MSFYGKVYTFQRHENYDVWLKSIGVPDDKIATIMAEKPSEKIVKNGDKYVLTEITSKGNKDITFKPGVEFEDIFEEDNTPYKATITVDSSTITQVITSSYGVVTLKREYSGDNLVVHIFSDKYDGVAKMYYKA